MIDRLKEWVADLVQRHWVPREDYNNVQLQQWRAEQRADVAHRQMHEVMDDAMRGVGEGVIRWAANPQAKMLAPEQTRMPAFRWIITVDPAVFYSLHSAPRSKIVKEQIVGQATRAFEEHLAETLQIPNGR